MDYNTRIVLIGVSLLGGSAGMIGCFAVLRRRSLTGDALAHAALPGLCLAYLLWQQRSLPVLLLGAFISGLLGIVLISALRRYTRIKEDAAIGIILSVFFGAGVALYKIIQRSPGGGMAGLDTYIYGKTAGLLLADVYFITALSLAAVLIILLLYKEFQLVVFDPDFAQAQGWPALRLDLLLMALMAVAVIVGLPAVGVLLMAALLIIPAAAARFWTDRLGPMLVWSALFGVGAGVSGTLVSASVDRLPAGPAIILAAASLFLVSMLLAPGRGGLARLLAHWRFRSEVEERRLLRTLYDLTEKYRPERPPLTFSEILAGRSWTVPRLQQMLAGAVQRGELEQVDPSRYLLTALGLHQAAAVALEQRLLELLLHEHAQLGPAFVHLGDRPLHTVLPEELYNSLCNQLRQQGRWPDF